LCFKGTLHAQCSWKRTGSAYKWVAQVSLLKPGFLQANVPAAVAIRGWNIVAAKTEVQAKRVPANHHGIGGQLYEL
jgi:hypothetical protein